MKPKLISLVIAIGMLATCSKQSPPSYDIQLRTLSIKWGKTQLKETQKHFKMLSCDGESYEETTDCYYLKWSCWNRKIESLHVTFTFDRPTQHLIKLFLGVELKKNERLSMSEVKTILTDHFGLTTQNLSQLITTGVFKQATFEEHFWWSQEPNPNFYYKVESIDLKTKN